MRKLTVDDLYLLSKIADKMDFELPSFDGANDENAQREYGMKLFSALFKKMHKAKDEISELVESVTGKNAKEMSVKELMETFKSIMSQEGALDVFN